MRLRSHKPGQRGYTLFELLIAVALLGVLSWEMAPALATFGAVKKTANRDTQTVINQRIAQAMLDWSEAKQFAQLNEQGQTYAGTLPPVCDAVAMPYSALTNPNDVTQPGCNTDLAGFLTARGISADLAVSDLSANKNRRVYQMLSHRGMPNTTYANLYVDLGLFGGYAPIVKLAYDVGVVYATDCGATTCAAGTDLAPQPLGAVDDASTGYQIADPYWTPGTLTSGQPTIENQRVGYGVAYISTLPLQKKFLAQTAANLTSIQSAMKSFYGAKGYYPYPSTTDMGASNTGLSPFRVSGLNSSLENSGCWTQWVQLDTDSTLLNALGMPDSQVATTAWRGNIMYCANYDPQGVKTAATYTAGPLYGAFQIGKEVSDSPSTYPGDWNSVVISF